MSTLVHPRIGPRIAPKLKRSWLLTFADVLMQLLAFFIMRLAISPYRPNAVISPPQQNPANELGGKVGHPVENLSQLHLLKFHRVSFTDGIQAELSKLSLPDSLSDVSFSLTEELRTLSLAFGGGDYLFTITETVCDHSEADTHPVDAVSASAGLVVRALIKSGIRPECLQVGSSQPSPEACRSEDPNDPGKPGAVRLVVEQRQCEPFVN